MIPPKKRPKKPGRKLVIVWSFIHPKTKQRIHAKNGKPFAFYVDVDKAA